MRHMGGCLLVIFGFVGLAFAKESIQTNNISVPKPPEWLNEGRVNAVTGKIQNNLEWDIRRVTLTWYDSMDAFMQAHHGPASILAFTRTSDQQVFMGPKVTSDNFDRVFGHELVHVILDQKYKGAVPPWLQEGLANFESKMGPVDYKWLATQPPQPITALTHPIASTNIRYHYEASQAAVEMITSRCSLPDLLQLSVGKKLETYLGTYCEIKDMNGDLQKWIEKKAKG